MFTKSLTAGALVALICATTVACSSSDTSAEAGKETVKTDAKAEAKAAEQKLNYGGVGAEPAQDPHGSLFNETDWVRLRAVYDTLISTDTKGKRVAGLAESMEPNDDASEWIIKLPKHATFSDGSPLTSADVLYSLKRLDEKKAENGMRLATVDAAKSKAVDDNTVTLATSTPDADLPRALSDMIFIVKKDTNTFDTHVGAGAFTVKDASAQATTLERRDDFWGDKPSLESVTIYNFADPKALAQAMTSKKVDVAVSIPAVTAKTLSTGKDIKILKREGAVSSPLLMRVDSGPFAKAEVREAVKVALDRKAMVDTVYSGYGVTGKDMMKLNDPSVPSDVAKVKQDTAKAKELLEKAGVTSLDVTLHTTTAYPAMKATATVAKEQLKEVGINVTIKEHDPTTYWSKAYTVEPFTVGYWTNTPFATTVRQTTLSTSGFSETGWKNAEFDKAFTEAMAVTDDSKRNAALGELHKQMAKDGGWAVWGFGDAMTAARSNVKGLNEKYNTYDLTGVSLSGE